MLLVWILWAVFLLYGLLIINLKVSFSNRVLKRWRHVTMVLKNSVLNKGRKRDHRHTKCRHSRSHRSFLSSGKSKSQLKRVKTITNQAMWSHLLLQTKSDNFQILIALLTLCSSFVIKHRVNKRFDLKTKRRQTPLDPRARDHPSCLELDFLAPWQRDVRHTLELY